MDRDHFDEITTKALYNFTPTDNRHIGLRVGDVIADIHHLGNGWVTGHNTNTGEIGIFPANYVESNITEEIRKAERRAQVEHEAEHVHEISPLPSGNVPSIDSGEVPSSQKPVIAQKPKLPRNITTEHDADAQHDAHGHTEPLISRIPPPLPTLPPPVIVKKHPKKHHPSKETQDQPHVSRDQEVPTSDDSNIIHQRPQKPPSLPIHPRLPQPDMPHLTHDEDHNSDVNDKIVHKRPQKLPTLPVHQKLPQPDMSHLSRDEDLNPDPADTAILKRPHKLPLLPLHQKLPQPIDQSQDVEDRYIRKHSLPPSVDPSGMTFNRETPITDVDRNVPPKRIQKPPSLPLHPKLPPHNEPVEPLAPPNIIDDGDRHIRKHSLPPSVDPSGMTLNREAPITDVDRNLPPKKIQKPPSLPLHPKLPPHNEPVEPLAPPNIIDDGDESVKDFDRRQIIKPRALPAHPGHLPRHPVPKLSGDVGVNHRISSEIHNVSDDVQPGKMSKSRVSDFEKVLFGGSQPIDKVDQFEFINETRNTTTIDQPKVLPALHSLSPDNNTHDVHSELSSMDTSAFSGEKDTISNIAPAGMTSSLNQQGTSTSDRSTDFKSIVPTKRIDEPSKKPVAKKLKGTPKPRQRRKRRRKHYGYKDIIGKKHAFSCKKVGFGILGAMFAGGIFFVMSITSFGYDAATAGWMTLGFTVLLCLILPLSMYFRLLIVLMVPALFTGKGRGAFLAIIFGVVLSGPLINIFNNGKEVGKSMACVAQIIKNQVLALAKQLVEPVQDIARQLNSTFHDVLKVVDEALATLKPIEDAIKEVEKALNTIKDQLTSIYNQCKTNVDAAAKECADGLNSAKKECEDKVNSVQDAIIDTGSDVYKKGKDVISGVIGRRRRSPTEKGHVLGDTLKNYFYNRVKRGLDDVCSPLGSGGNLCKNLKAGDTICSPLSKLQDEAEKLINQTLEQLKGLENFFIFGINADFGLTKDINISKLPSQVVDDVTNELVAGSTWVLSLFSIFTQIMIITLAVLFIKSILYVKNYNAKDHYDNIYITHGFRKFDAACQKAGKKTVLPLKRREVRKYTDSTSFMLSQTEMKHTYEGSSVVGLHLCLTACIILGDYALYYIMLLVQKYGEIDVEISGVSIVQLEVDGNGPIADILRTLITNIQIDGTYDVYFNMTQCLPNPSAPDFTNIFLFFFLYFIAAAFVCMQAFGLRARRKIASMYYPEREFERIHWLHEKIRHKRMTIFGWLFQHLKSKKKEKDVSERITLSSWFYYRCPLLATYVCNCKPKSTTCLCCGVSDDGLTKFKVCQSPGCDAIYCMECFGEMKKRCYRCKKRKFDDDD